MRTQHKQIIEDARAVMLVAGGQLFVLHQSGRVFGSAGVPDCLWFAPSRFPQASPIWRFGFFEAKSQGDKLRLAQLAFRRLCILADIPYISGRAGDLADHLGL